MSSDQAFPVWYAGTCQPLFLEKLVLKCCGFEVWARRELRGKRSRAEERPKKIRGLQLKVPLWWKWKCNSHKYGTICTTILFSPFICPRKEQQNGPRSLQTGIFGIRTQLWSEISPSSPFLSISWIQPAILLRAMCILLPLHSTPHPSPPPLTHIQKPSEGNTKAVSTRTHYRASWATGSDLCSFTAAFSWLKAYKTFMVHLSCIKKFVFTVNVSRVGTINVQVTTDHWVRSRYKVTSFTRFDLWCKSQKRERKDLCDNILGSEVKNKMLKTHYSAQ